jgi:hypothetical protein
MATPVKAINSANVAGRVDQDNASIPGRIIGHLGDGRTQRRCCQIEAFQHPI